MIQIRINPLFYLLLFVAGLTGKVATFALVFLSVLIHEMAHLLTAFGFGYRAAAVELFPFGGVAKLDYSLFNNPLAEGVTAAAGPLQSLILAGLAVLSHEFAGLNWIAEELFRINLGLAVFNCLPLFPLDGGRIIRSWLAAGVGYGKATRILVFLTRTVAILTFPMTVFLTAKNIIPPHLPVLSLFLLAAAREENFFYAYLQHKQLKESRFTVKGFSPARIWMVGGERFIAEVIPFLTGKDYHLFLITNKNREIIGILKEDDLLSGISQRQIATFYGLWLAKGEKKDIITFERMKKKTRD